MTGTTPDTKRDPFGIDFVDILFALVVGEVLSAATNWSELSGPAQAHLAFAATLTLTSWIGYHNSVHSYHGEITFSKNFFPLLKLLLDIALVVAYWFAVRSAEGLFGNALTPSARSEVAITLVSFVLYVAWDAVAYGAAGRSAGAYFTGRRVATLVGLVCAATVFLLVVETDPHDPKMIVLVDVALMVLLYGYRVLKERLRPRQPEGV